MALESIADQVIICHKLRLGTDEPPIAIGGLGRPCARIQNTGLREWLPNSGYELDNRPDFEILGAKYINCNTVSEEDICTPIKKSEE